MAGFPEIYFKGGELGDFQFTNGSPIHGTVADFFRSSHARAYVQCGGTSVDVTNLEHPLPNVSSLWLTFRVRHSGIGSTDSRSTRLFFGDRELRFRNHSTTSSTIVVYLWDGATETTLVTASSTINITGGLRKIDIFSQINGDGADIVRVYGDGSLLAEITDTSFGAESGFTKFRLGNLGNTNSARYSEVIVANVPTINMGLAIKELTGDGFHDDQTGDYEDINALAINDAAGIGLENDGDQYSATAAALSGSAEAFVWGVAFQMRGARGPTGPDRLDFGIRRDGTTIYDAGAQVTPPLILGPVSPLMFLDPHTNAPWDKTDLDASEFAIRAVESA